MGLPQNIKPKTGWRDLYLGMLESGASGVEGVEVVKWALERLQEFKTK